jgi:hypothetical protein
MEVALSADPVVTRMPVSPVPAPELCVVVPVLNERDNVAPLVDKLRETLAGLCWEVIFVDDGSTDGTRDAVAAKAWRRPSSRASGPASPPTSPQWMAIYSTMSASSPRCSTNSAPAAPTS